MFHGLARFTAITGAFVFAAWLVVLRPTYLGGPATYVVVSGASMQPTLNAGDLALLLKDDNYAAGDIIGFRIDEGVVIHRIVGGSPEEGFTTNGDNKASPDIWNPRPAQILGKMWLDLPRGGQLLLLMRQPLALGLFSAALGTFLVFGAVPSPGRRPNGRRRPSSARPTLGLLVGGGLLLTVAVVALLGTVAAFRIPADRVVSVERSRYEHQGSLNYVMRARPSVVYEGEVVGPGTPLYTRLAKSIDLTFVYALKTNGRAVASGEHELELRIAARDGWAKSLSLSVPTSFSGTSFAAQETIDIANVLELISEVEKDTGVVAAAYELTVVPTVRVHGQAGPQEFEDSFSPVFAFELTRTQIKPPKEREVREAHSLTEERTDDAVLALGGLTMSVRLARWGGLAVLVVTLVATASLVASGLGEFQRSEPTRIRARYGSLLVNVVDGDGSDDIRRVGLASMGDLARVAQHGSGMVLEQELLSGGHVYYVRDGGVRYEYRIDGNGQMAEEAALSPREGGQGGAT